MIIKNKTGLIQTFFIKLELPFNEDVLQKLNKCYFCYSYSFSLWHAVAEYNISVCFNM